MLAEKLKVDDLVNGKIKEEGQTETDVKNESSSSPTTHPSEYTETLESDSDTTAIKENVDETGENRGVSENETTPEVSRVAELAKNADKQVDQVTKVVDGDTIYTSKYKIRIIGLDTPETKDPRKPVQCFGVEASAKMRSLVGGKKVYLETDASQDTRDKYGRALRNVYLEDGTNVAHTMIRDGYGYEYTYGVPYKWQAEYKAAQKYAEQNELGLWAPQTCDGQPRAVDNEVEPEAVSDEAAQSTEHASAVIMGVSKLADGRIKVNGYAPKNSTIALILANDEKVEGKPKNDGSFSITLPASTSPYGTLTLTKVSGFWLFKNYDELHDKYYYSLFNDNESLKETPYQPVITSIKDDGDGHELRGYYQPDSKLLLKSGKTILASDDTDKNGEFVFTGIKTNSTYTQVQLKTYTTEWLIFGVKEGNTILNSYIDAKNNKASSSMPIITKTETKAFTIPFETITKESSSLAKGKTKVSQKGKNGEETFTYKVTYRGDKKIKSKPVDSEITLAPVNKIILKGTYVKPQVVSKPAPSNPAPQTPSVGGVVKMSNSGICHAPGTTYYNRTTYFTSYGSVSACLAAGGRLPLR